MSARQQVLMMWLSSPSLDSRVLGWSFFDGTAGAGPQPVADPPYPSGVAALVDGDDEHEAAGAEDEGEEAAAGGGGDGDGGGGGGGGGGAAIEAAGEEVGAAALALAAAALRFKARG